jgi:hypothetical protein
MTKDVAGAGADALAVVEHRQPAKVAANVDEDPVGLGLAIEAGATGAEGHRRLRPPAIREDLGDVVRVAGQHHHLRKEPVRAGVGRVANDVARAGEQAIGAEQLRQLTA